MHSTYTTPPTSPDSRKLQSTPPVRDSSGFASRLRALLDGFAIHVAIGLRGTDREQVLGHVREFLADGLLAPS